MIINIRGTHGSGKSTIIKNMLTRYNAEHIPVEFPDKPDGYRFPLDNGKQVYVVGSYKNACGGCDSIQPYGLIWPRVLKYAECGHVLFEGALVSSSYGNIGRDSEVFGQDFVFAFLDTPLEVCLDRIRQRRAAKGNNKPLDPKNTQYKFDNIQRSIGKIRDEFKRRVVILDYRRAQAQILGLLYAAK